MKNGETDTHKRTGEMEKKPNFIQRLFRRNTEPTTTFTNLPIDVQNGVIQFATQGAIGSPEVKTVINSIAETFATIPIYHKRILRGGIVEYPRSTIESVFNIQPNVLQDKVKFWVTVVSQLLTNNIVAILPEFDHNENLVSLTPLPDKVNEPIEKNGRYYYDIASLTRRFEASELIILSRFSTIKGTSGSGEITLHKQIAQAIQKLALTNAQFPKTVQAYLKMRNNQVLSEEALKKKAEVVAKQFSNGVTSANGFNVAYVQADAELHTIDIRSESLDTNLLNAAIDAIYEFYGVSRDYVKNNVDEFKNELVINKFFRPLALQVACECTRKLFTRDEINHGNRIELDLTALQVNTLQAKVALIKEAVTYGVATPNELREYFDWGKKENGLGDRFYTTLNIVDEEINSQYQLTSAASGKGTDNKLKGDKNETQTNNSGS